MKNKMKWLFSLAVIAMLCFSQPLFAQPDPDPGPGGPGGPPAGAPIGGGAEILITLGLAYAISKYRGSKKEE